MKPILIAATTIVNLALIFYSIGIITEQVRHSISRRINFSTVGKIMVGQVCLERSQVLV